MAIIQCREVCKKFGEKVALDHVSLDIPEGGIFGLLGPNGAGKTTLIRIINRITIPNSGDVLFNGAPITQEDVARIGYMPEERGLYRKMKVGDQAMYLARLKGMSAADARKALKDWFVRFGIQDWWDKKVEELSKGMAQKLQFITTVVHKPSLMRVTVGRANQNSVYASEPVPSATGDGHTRVTVLGAPSANFADGISSESTVSAAWPASASPPAALRVIEETLRSLPYSFSLKHPPRFLKHNLSPSAFATIMFAPGPNDSASYLWVSGKLYCIAPCLRICPLRPLL